jgi:PAS domain-containing protein
MKQSEQTSISSSADLSYEYALLTKIAANLRSGFILLNQAEDIVYANPSAQRLLGLASDLVWPLPAFDLCKQLLTLAANPSTAQAELERLWRAPEEESFVDLALTDTAIRWLRVQSFPVLNIPGHLVGRGVLLDDITPERSATQSHNETLALAAHELKTPLAIIKGSATTLLSNSMRWARNAANDRYADRSLA